MTLRIQSAKKQRAQLVARANNSPVLALRTPEEIAQNSRLEQVVLTLRHDTRPVNTIKALDAKQEECMQHCDKVHANDNYKCTLDT